MAYDRFVAICHILHYMAIMNTRLCLIMTLIFSSILRISSDRGKYKAFSTCGSHLLVVSLFFGTGLAVKLSSVATLPSRISVMASVMYTMVTPMLIHIICSLRNRDIKVALGRVLSKMVPLRESMDACLL
ncbi:Olfactory receptor 7C2 [Sciurus carolinensis]|uniref:Olfactory receptor 7C2 n=1 Tax=Sciurus carolinensis TaxID=30640 RepID=A0AA41MJY6_SCICA|nr:Olfactory receptor 7C2 [Sciurus carolinensis]